MLRYTIALFLLILSLPTFSQLGGIKCTYVTTMDVKKGFMEIEDDMVRQIMLERLRDDKKLYSLTFADGKYLFCKEPESIDKMPLEIDVKSIYINFNDSAEIKQLGYGGKLYIICSRTNTYQWELTSETEILFDKICYKATLKNDPTITAWFTPDIPMGCAPLGYHGLPGLVVRMKTPIYTLNLSNITNVDKAVLEAPKDGKCVTEAEFEKLVYGYTKKLLDNAGSVKEYK